jgi:drug/metabolite transporter (DMT)-like permease
VLLGAVLSGEPVGATTVIANALIVAAVALVLRRRAHPHPAKSGEPAPREAV